MTYPIPKPPTPPKNYGFIDCQGKVCATPETFDYLIDMEIWARKIKAAPVWGSP